MSSQTQADSPRRLRVFLCHSSGDKLAVHNLYRRLKACNVDPWLDKENLLPGQDWDLEIQRAVRKSDVVLICLSRDFVVKEGYGQKEIKLALDTALEKPEGTIFLIPLRLEECEEPERLKPFQRVDYFEEDGFDRLIRALQYRGESLKERRKGKIEPIDCKTQVREFIDEYQRLTRTAAKAVELRNAFQIAATSKLNIPDLRWERDQPSIRRNRVIIVFKDKGLFDGRVTSKKFEDAKKQLLNNYIPDQAYKDGREESDYIGICFDGMHLAFVFKETEDNIRVTDIKPFDERSAEVLALALDKDDRLELTPQNLVNDFGPNSEVARTLLGALWKHLDFSLTTHVSRAEMLYSEWIDLFEQGTSLGEIGKSRLSVYLTSIGLPAEADPTRVLFVLHTYHALFFKLLAAEVVLTNRLFPGTRGDYCFGAAAMNDKDLKESLDRDIEDSDLFHQVGIFNFVEGSFFAWYLVDLPTELINAIRVLLQRLILYRLSDLQLTRTRDIVKHVYQQLVPIALRHNIGEYFTPEWLVEFTMDRAGYNGAQILKQKYLDPCCGSGNFLIHAIDRYKKQARAAGWGKKEILQGIVDHIFGFDLNPLAVLTARVSYLIAISDLIATDSDIEIPIYQADAIYAPTVSATADKANPICNYQIGTRIKTINLELPEALILKRQLFAHVLKFMERTIRQRDSEDIFVEELKADWRYTAEPDRHTWEPFLLDMFRKVENLEKLNWNHVWCRIVRNYFASVAVGKCQVIAGNPPWVRWSELPSSYANRIKPTCDAYGIFSQDRYFGGNELDISGMITYTVADKWLDDHGGLLSFVITKSHLQSQSSGGFRRFQVNGVPLKVQYVDDLEKVRPFMGLGNKPIVLSLEKGQPTTYPVEYIEWERTTLNTISDDIPLSTARPQLRDRVFEANSLSDAGQRWSILPPGRFRVLKMLDGEDPNIEGRKGILTDMNGVYFIEPLGPGGIPNTLRFRNTPDRGKRSVPSRTDEVELDLVYPLIKGAENIRAFRATISPIYVIIPNKRISTRSIPTVAAMREKHPAALQYFRAINAVKTSNGNNLLEDRSTWKKRVKPQYDELVRQGKTAITDVPFYAIYDVGDYTFSAYKVVWAEMGSTLQAAVISNAEVPYGGGIKVIVPDHKVYFAAFDDLDHAHYICALLNSEPVRGFIDSFTIKIQVGSLFRHVKLPPFDSSLSNHFDLVRFSKEAHAILASTMGTGSIDVQRRAIDELTNQILTQTNALKYHALELPWEQ